MRVFYCDLNHNDHFEDYSAYNCKRYGGGRIFAAYAKESLNDENNEFWIGSNPKSFENLGNDERKDRCINLSDEQRQSLRNGANLKEIIPDADKFDIVCHHTSDKYINIDGLKAKQIAWSVGLQEHINPNFNDFILYNNYQHPVIFNDNTKFHKAIIGVPIPAFQEYEKEKYIFQCTRHTPVFGSIEVAKFCRHFNIPCIFAGPLDRGYDLPSYCDGNVVKYLGVISEKDKIELTKKARLSTFLHHWKTPMNLSALQTLSYGTPLAVTKVGFWPSLINEKNGFFVDSSESLLHAYENADKIKQLDCYDTAKNFSTERMISEFVTIFEKILS